MRKIFLVLGYGVPRDITTDLNYNIYLRAALNRIYDETRGGEAPLIIASGGKTDMVKPYRRSEAGEIVRFLKAQSRQPALKKLTKDWEFVAETAALSTLENFLFTLMLLKDRGITEGELVVFSEYTRANRLKKLAPIMLPREYRARIIPIDFDTSVNRYLDPRVLADKARREIAFARWALKNADNMERYHQYYVERLAFLHSKDAEEHPEAVKAWLEQHAYRTMQNAMGRKP